MALAAEGATVVIYDIAASGDAAKSVVADIEAAGGQAVFETADVTDLGAVTEMVDRVFGKFDRFDVLICNAGILRDRTFAKIDMGDFALVLAVHLQRSTNCCHAVWAHMRECGYRRPSGPEECVGTDQ